MGLVVELVRGRRVGLEGFAHPVVPKSKHGLAAAPQHFGGLRAAFRAVLGSTG